MKREIQRLFIRLSGEKRKKEEKKTGRKKDRESKKAIENEKEKEE